MTCNFQLLLIQTMTQSWKEGWFSGFPFWDPQTGTVKGEAWEKKNRSPNQNNWNLQIGKSDNYCHNPQIIPISDKNDKEVIKNLSKTINDIFTSFFIPHPLVPTVWIKEAINQKEAMLLKVKPSTVRSQLLLSWLIFWKMRIKQKLQGCVGLTAPTLSPITGHQLRATVNSFPHYKANTHMRSLLGSIVEEGKKSRVVNHQ